VLDEYEAASRLKAEWDFFVRLRDAGRRTAKSWLASYYQAIGTRSTMDVEDACREGAPSRGNPTSQ
jgi:NTE family protein